MSAPAWLLDAIHSTALAIVPSVPNTKKPTWVQDGSHETLNNTGFVSHVPIVPNVPNEIGLFQAVDYVDAFGDSSLSDSKTVDHVELQRERRRTKVLDMLEGKRFALLVDDDATDPVIATVAIRNVATFEMAIPQHSYDGMVLLELIEKHYGENNE